jgi:hypothetical protein
MGCAELRLHLFVAFILAGDEWSDSRSCRFNPGNRAPSVYYSRPGWFRNRYGYFRKQANFYLFQAKKTPEISRLKTSHFPELVYVILWVHSIDVSGGHVKASVLMDNLE